MAVDVTEATFQTEVIDRSNAMPVVVDLWAEWCGPCVALGPMIERIVEKTNGAVALVKIDVDANPSIAKAFEVQSIPAVFALRNGVVIDQFIGALPEQQIQQFVDGLLPSAEEQHLAALIAEGDEVSLRSALEIDPGNEDAIVALGDILVASGRGDEALGLLARIPESERTRKVAAGARLSMKPIDDHDATLTELLDQVKADDEARQQFVDILEVMGNEDPRTAVYRKKLTARLY